MPVPISTEPFVIDCRCASAIPVEVWEAFKSDPRTSNIMLPHALKWLGQEHAGHTPPPDQLWLVCATYASHFHVHSSSSPPLTVDFVLSCTEHAMGKYPVFIWTPHLNLSTEFIIPRVRLLAKKLRAAVPVPRVFSVFAPDDIANAFVAEWSKLTGIRTVSEPYYHAKFAVCNQRTFRNKSLTVQEGYVFELRPATPADLDGVAELCHGFADQSEPFVLSHAEARREAQLLIQNRQVWVHCVVRDGVRGVASIVAFTRVSDTAAAITKVYTNPQWRRLGCAERLVRRVCRDLLRKYSGIVLYVGHNNSAARVYDRVGFVGLGPGSYRPGVPVQSWIEIGFDRQQVNLGHW
ncbi:hypothetical protein FISHEDRAFT_66616 [Fistulina hepatica ATCC 64428]|uniref:N-acetyltransferase domain-containing protein n=1 Tax=Fistulina hepatica ATCC 64428 TaxID=1128425 RepID=A0A0D7A5T4_9AGAR|nr:hypothetical protein FISHEDRAFT_66616 [Fistulina hepatica ATCC 64428]